MEISAQIKKQRQSMNLSQEELAEKVFVTRQTISNWENGKNYPDINSLVLLSNLFGVSLDILVKGDLVEMKEQIKTEDIKAFNRETYIFTALIAAACISGPLATHFWGTAGFIAWLPLLAVAIYWSIRVEMLKKKHNLDTYREIVAFTEGKRLDEIEQAREDAKRPYQKILGFVAGAVMAVIGALIAHFIV